MDLPVMLTRAPPATMLDRGEMAIGVGYVVVPAFHNDNTVTGLQILIKVKLIKSSLCFICVKALEHNYFK